MNTMETEIRQVQNYMKDIPVKKRIKMIKSVNSEQELFRFESRLNYILGMFCLFLM